MFFYLALGSRAESVTPNCVNNSPKFYRIYMSPVSPVFHTVVTVSIGLKNVSRVRASILQY